MKYLVLVLFMILKCQSLNQTVLSEEAASKLLPRQNESLGIAGPLPDPHYQQTQAQGPQSLPTTLSRVIETKYGKVQGLSLTLFPSHSVKGSHPLRNKIVEVMPDIRDESGALKEMPRGYLDYLRRVEPYLRNQSEDCLYLNIFSPVEPEPKGKLKPVLVFIHGGKFSWGSGNLYDGTLVAAAADFLFVTLNYRLGVLGFLNVNPSPQSRPRVANYGLMDQIAALHWLKENIGSFGGDPENITLMGYEAGAACIHFLMTSPAVMSGLFHKVILISGSAHAPWALVEDPAGVASSLAETLNCSMGVGPAGQNLTGAGGREAQHGGKSMGPPAQADPLIDCLKNKHFSYFSKFYPPKFSVDFGPSIDGVVIRPNFKATSTVEQQMGKRDLSRKYDLLFGVSSLEMLTAFSEADLSSGFEFLRRDAILRTLIRNSYRFHLNEILATITNEYVDWERSVQHPIATRDLTLNAVTDCMSLAPVISASDSSLIKKSYFYVFEHSTKEGLYNYQRTGAGGGEELNYMLGFPLMEAGVPYYPPPLPSNYTKSEMALSELLITHLSNFVHTGDPNEPIKSEGTWPMSKERNKFRTTAWEPYDRLHQKYLELTANKVRIRSHFRAHQMAIWLRLVPELQRSGAHFASLLHNRLKGGNEAALYVGSLRLPHEPELGLDPQTGLEGELGEGYYNGTGIPPSPPTTCYSPLSSLASESASRAAAEASPVGPVLGPGKNGTTGLGSSSTFSPYTTALSLTIAIGCSLLILNVFIFALVYYQRDKRRSEERRSRADEETSGLDHQLRSYGDPPELLKSNLTTGTSFHQSVSPGESLDGSAAPGQPTSPHYPNAAGPVQRPPHKEVHFSPRLPQHNHTAYPAGGGDSDSQQLIGIATVPRVRPQGNNVGGGGAGTIQRKPPPPTRNLTNYTISQRQIFSLIMSIMTMGIL